MIERLASRVLHMDLIQLQDAQQIEQECLGRPIVEQMRMLVNEMERQHESEKTTCRQMLSKASSMLFLAAYVSACYIAF